MPTTVSPVSRTCARSTCRATAVATLSYSYADRIVWVEPLIIEAHPMVHDLCEDHAGSIRVPMGWELRDQRELSVDLRNLRSEPASAVRFDLIGA